MDDMRKQILTLILALIMYPLAFYIEYLIVKRLIKFGIDYFFNKKYSFHEYKEIRTEINEIAKDLEKHQEGDR